MQQLHPTIKECVIIFWTSNSKDVSYLEFMYSGPYRSSFRHIMDILSVMLCTAFIRK